MADFALISRLRAAASPEGEAKEKKSTRMARTMRVLTFYVSISRTY